MTIISFLREADFVVSIFANLAVLFVSFPAYKRTKLLPFSLLIWGSFVGILLAAAVHIYRTRGSSNDDEVRQFQEIYRIGFIICNGLSTAGVVLLIRQFMAQFARKDDRVA